MIAIVDYGVGNIKNVVFAFKRLGIEAKLTSKLRHLEKCDGMILPGVGAFAPAMEKLRKKLMEPVIKLAQDGKPLMGICVGHQLLFSESEENGLHPGLNLLKGKVKRFTGGVKVPHMGWNQVNLVRKSVIFDGIDDGSYFYFAHSFYVSPEEQAVVVGTAGYNLPFCCCLQSDNIFGVQFHPEKSGEQGLRLLWNFHRYCFGSVR